MRTLYSVPTANGQRASIALEECGLDYGIRLVNLFDGEHRSDDMLKVNPFGRMPDGLDPYPNIARWAGQVGAREAVARRMQASSA